MRVKVKRKSKTRKNEISPNTPCLCGSGKPYGECCRNKKFKYEFRDGEIVKSIPISKELIHILNDQQKQFEEYYNRTPGKNDYVVSFAPSYNNDILLQLVYSMREYGIPEERIYAYYKTDGLIPCEFNFDLVSDMELNEYTDYYNEYINLMSESEPDAMNALQFVMLSNRLINDEINYVFEALTSTCYDFIHRHTKSEDALCFATKDSLDFCIFSVVKTVKTLTSIEKLQKNHMPECIYSLGRSFFENYMYICAINVDHDFFNTKLLPLIDDENYNLFIQSNGKISRKKVTEKSTGKTSNIQVNIAQLKKYFKYATDNELYDDFYADACQYVHVDILSAKQYYSIVDIYDQINPTLVASVSVLSIALMTLNEICECELVDKQYVNDFKNLYAKLHDKLVDCLTIIDSDPQHKIPLVTTLLKRFDES